MQIDLDTLFANATSPYVLLDSDLRIVWANEAYLNVTERSRDSLIGCLMTDAFPAPADSVSDQMLRGSFRQVLATGQPDHLPLIPYPIKAAGGRVVNRYWSATHTPIPDAKGRVAFILQNTVDVTDLYLGEQKTGVADLERHVSLLQRAEAVTTENLALGKITEFFQSAFDQAPSFMAILNGPEHMFKIVNQSYTDLIGGREVIGLPLREALPDLDGQGFIELLDQVYRTGEPVSFKAMPARLQASQDARPEQYFVDFIFHPLKDDSGAAIGIFVQGHDVTGQLVAEAELAARREKFRIMAQTMPNHVWTADKEGSLDWLNVQTYKFTGYKEGDLFGSDWARVVHPDDLEAAKNKWAYAIHDGIPYETEFRIRKADGSYRWHIVRASPLRTSEGTLTGWVGTNTDIEDRKNFEAEIAKVNATLETRVARRNRELEELNAALRHSQKLEAIGGLAGGIAHDFNNLLQVITGKLRFAMREIGPESPARAHLDQAMSSVRRGATLASQLLSFARKQPLSPTVTNLGRLVSEAVDMLHTAIGEGVELELRFDDGLWNINVDRSSMENALLNLAINARDAMDGQGKLAIHIGNVTLDEAYAQTQPHVAPGPYICVKVTDSGRGMSPEIVNRIFEPFFTTKADGNGTGLGLSMVYGFAIQSGGYVRVESEVAVGTSINIYLPRSFEEEQAIHRGAKVEVLRGSETILLVEDDDEVRAVAFNMLTDLGYIVLQAPDAEQALNLLASDRHIDLLFTDVVMPGEVNGQVLAERIREMRPGVPVLFTSGFVQDRIVQDGRLNDGVQLIGKPYTEVQLAQKIREVIECARTALGSTLSDAVAGTNQTVFNDTLQLEGIRILICEDDALIRLDLAEELRDVGYEVLEAANAREALNFLRSEAINVLVTDVGLPDRSGQDLAREAREIYADLPVIFATGGVDVTSAKDMDDCIVLSKPFESLALRSSIEAILISQ
ncbi:hybrid sensor histidine kinase/response regulator [Arenibacterium halophilum]|uniref:histidine kinase n=1 Tax=Arenibacterium halophilum TaxID=2583821 RepID=A0ABY2WX54_9RHOB|nr:response regulator [Arenibacterium halophilum]TMV07422.1 response regulator [Arenibacterium halophilum]